MDVNNTYLSDYRCVTVNSLYELRKYCYDNKNTVNPTQESPQQQAFRNNQIRQGRIIDIFV